MSTTKDSANENAQEGKAVIKVLAVVLDRLVGANSHLTEEEKGQVTKFHALKAPVIAIGPYLERIHKYASCSNECFILALIYIDRLIQRNNFLLTELNVHRVIITAILLAAKFFDDAYYNNAYYAKVGGVLVSELNSLEVEFLFRINFSLRVAPDVFEKYNAELSSHAASMGLQSPNQQYDVLLQGYGHESDSGISQNQRAAEGSLYLEAEPTSEPFVHVQHPTACEAPAVLQEPFYQQPQIGVNCAMMTQQNLQNPPHITPSPPPHPPYVQGNISYASDLAGAMHEPSYQTTHTQAPHTYYQMPGEATATSSTDSFLINWPHLFTMPSTSPSLLHHQEKCSSQSQGLTTQNHQDYEYAQSDISEWQMYPSNYGGQHLVSSPATYSRVKS